MRTFLTCLFLLVTILKAQAQPQLYWGTSNGKTGICPEERVLAIQTATYEGLDWEMTIDKQVKKGKGSYLSPEISSWIHQFRKDSLKIAIRVNYRTNSTKSNSTLQNTYFFTNSIYKSDLTKRYQGFILIDKNEANFEALFNADNPKSLMGIILQNPLPYPAFMSDQQVHAIQKKNPQTAFLHSTGFQSDTPLKSKKLDSLGRTVDSLHQSKEGYYSFIYPAPKEYSYDLTDISRLVLILDSVENPKTGEKYLGISRLGLAKKYPNSDKYDLVLTFSYPEFMQMNSFKLLVKADNVMTQQLTDSKSYFRNEFQQNCFKLTDENYDSVERNYMYFPYFTNLTERNRQAKSQLTSHLYEENSPFNADNRFAFGNNASTYFKDLKYVLGPESDVPLVNEYGDPMEKILDDGAIVFVYPPRDTIITWVGVDTIRVFTEYETAMNEEFKLIFVPRTIYFFTGVSSIPFLAFSLENSSDWRSNYYQMGLSILAKEGHFEKEFPASELPFVKLIAGIFNQKPLILKTSNAIETTRLFSEFNLERTGNLLNLELK